MDKKLNCWEFKNCGREPGGANALTHGVCPTASERRLDGVHGGSGGGRACWVVAGSMCDGKIQGTFARKFETCSTCDFYLAVRSEEQGGFVLSACLLAKLRSIGDRNSLPGVPGAPANLTGRKPWWREAGAA